MRENASRCLKVKGLLGFEKISTCIPNQACSRAVLAWALKSILGLNSTSFCIFNTVHSPNRPLNVISMQANKTGNHMDCHSYFTSLNYINIHLASLDCSTVSLTPPWILTWPGFQVDLPGGARGGRGEGGRPLL